MFNEREHYSISFLKFGKSKLNKKNKKFYDFTNQWARAIQLKIHREDAMLFYKFLEKILLQI